MEQRDIIIIGGGLLGCFAARALSAYTLSVTVLEAAEDVCTGVSRANTGIIYAGYDMSPGSLKAALTLRGNQNMAALCRELDVPYLKCGSLMVGCGVRAEGVLQKKYADGLANGVPGLTLLSGDAVRELEPALTDAVTCGLYAPEAGTVEPWALGIAAFENARANGVEFRFSEPVAALSRRDGGFLIETPCCSYTARAVLNCAGLSADRVRELCEAPLVRLFPTAGDYLVLDTTAEGFVRHVISHEPEQKGKGLTLVPTVSGNLLLGPTERPEGIPGAVEESGLAALRSLAAEVVPGLDLTQGIRSFSAMRPNPFYVEQSGGAWVKSQRRIRDFTVLNEAGLLSLIGIKTPGLTAAWSLGEYAAGLLIAYLGGAAQNTGFDPHRSAIPSPRAMPAAQRSALIAEKPEYGRILCRCRGISEGEIREAIARGAVSIDGVKRRTEAGMGRCQGGFCQAKVLELLARERNRAPENICLGAPGSELLRRKN